MPFISTPLAGAMSAINNTRKNQENVQEHSKPEPAPQRERNAFLQLFFGPGK